MKKEKIILFCGFLLLLFTLGLNQALKRNVVIGGNESIETANPVESVSVEMQRKIDQHNADLKAIDDAWEYIGKGSEYFKVADFEKAVIAYEKAYETDGGIRHVSGFDLAKTYEKLRRYEDAIDLLNNMIENKETNAYGEKKANEIITRLQKRRV